MTLALTAPATLLVLSFVIPPGGSDVAQNRLAPTQDPDVLRVVGLQGAARKRELRRLLIHWPDNAFRFHESVFYHEAQLRSALCGLVHDPKVGRAAADFLSLSGEPEDLHFIIQHPLRSKHQAFPDRWAYGAVSSLLDPGTDEEWLILRNCALGKYEDGWVEAGAIQALKLVASPRNEILLQEAQTQNQSWASAVASAWNMFVLDLAP
jgi:hypothetical protein